MHIDLSYCRVEFPALREKVGEYPAAFFDGPGGTQVPQRVIDAMTVYLMERNANVGGAFHTSRATDETITSARLAMADMLGAHSREICFGQNMTTLNFALAQTLARQAQARDEIFITELDHQANVDPWESLSDRGFHVQRIRVNPDTCTLELRDFEEKIGTKTLLVAITYASNAVGTVNDVSRIADIAHEAGALVLVDAVHYAAHGLIDVKEIDCDFLLCSAYKFFGPHVGVMYTKSEVAERLSPYKVRPQADETPYKFETGTLNHEGLAGVTAAVDFIASLGHPYKDQMNITGSTRRCSLMAGMKAIEEYEKPLLVSLLEGLSAIPGIKIYGPPPEHPRTPTVSFTMAQNTPCDVARFLGDRGIFVWDGDFYATSLVERLGLADTGGLIRVGLAPYTTPEEIDRLIRALEELA